MSLHAIDDIGDAIDATKSLFTPIDVREWLKLAVVVFFIGGGGGGLNNVQSLSNFGNQGDGGGGTGGTGGEFNLAAPLDGIVDGLVLQTGEPPLPSGAEQVLAEFGTVILAAVVVVGLLVLTYGLLSNFMEFVFVQSLIDREVHVRQYFSDHIGNGLRLLAFRLAVNLLTVLVVVAAGAVVFFLVLGGSAANADSGALFALFPLALVLFVGLGVLVGIVQGFTNVFVIPLMTSDDSGILGGWRQLLGSMTDHPKQYLGYLVVSVVLAIGVSIVSSILGIVAFFIVGIPFGIVGAGIWFGLPHGTAMLALLGVVGLLGFLALMVASSMIQAPLQAFLRYYAMLVLGDIDEALDPIPEVRTDIRA